MAAEHEVKYSYSRLDCFDQCGFRYYLKYICGNYPKTGSIALEFGTLVHTIEQKIGESIINKNTINYEVLIKEFLDTCTKIQARYPNDFIIPDKVGRTYVEKIDFYINTGIYRLEKFLNENIELELIGCEVPFKFKYNGQYTFRGSIDRILLNKVTGQYIVQDIKTYGVPLQDDDNTKDSHLVTPLQFVTYCLAMCELYDTDPTTIKCQYDLPLCDCIQDAGTKGFIARGKTKIDKLFNKINTQEFVPQPSPLCHWCDYCSSNDSADSQMKWLCPYMMHWTRETKDFSKENEWSGMQNYPIILEAYKKVNGIDSLKE